VVKDTRFHDLYQRAMQLLDDAKLLYVVRHPCGALNSWKRSNEFPEGADFDAEWRGGACRKNEGPGEYWGFDDWCALTERYLDLQAAEPERCRVFRYEALVRDPEAITRQLFGFVGASLPAQTTEFLRASRSRHDERPYAVFKDPSVADAWREQFPSSIRSAIEDSLEGTRLEGFLS
jgi:hypothetical protein